MVRPTYKETEMNRQETREIRELTTVELDEVTGGSIIVNAIRTAWKMALDEATRITEENNRDTCEVCTYVPCTQ
jgi:hypothetical protein